METLVAGGRVRTRQTSSTPRRCAAPLRVLAQKIVQERVFEDTGGARRTDSGVTLIQRQMPRVDAAGPGYDVLVAADESEVFASYLPYRTWDPRPVAVGRSGADKLGRAHDQWGAIQMQNALSN